MKKLFGLFLAGFFIASSVQAAGVTRSLSGNETMASLTVNTEVYDSSGWNGDLTDPTKDAVRDKIEVISVPNFWSDPSGVLYPTTSSDNLTLGGTSNIGKLGIIGDADEVQIAAKGNGTQTSKILDLMKSDGTHLMTLDNSGALVVSSTGTPALTLGNGSQATYVTTFDLTGTDTTLTGVSGGAQFSGTLSATTATVNTLIETNNAVSVSSNAGTVPVTSAHNTFTNSSAANMTITMATSGASDMQTSIVRIYDASAVAKTITWVNTEDSTVTAPTTSNGSTTLPLETVFHYNSATSKWRTVGKA